MCKQQTYNTEGASPRGVHTSLLDLHSPLHITPSDALDMPVFIERLEHFLSTFPPTRQERNGTA
jgi:hypothetical protein